MGTFHSHPLGEAKPGKSDIQNAVDDSLMFIFGCTEIGMLLAAGDVAVPTFDTTALHAAAAVDWALG